MRLLPSGRGLRFPVAASFSNPDPWRVHRPRAPFFFVDYGLLARFLNPRKRKSHTEVCQNGYSKQQW
jgi:hypothetical protein